ncbi:helix-turn-helix transcriptional regulator [Paraburkholderia sp. EG286B]|uniref:helix-turn-helix transcriptional regulator n=1 Tax=Paraburkholderia sp. EG286B TaxID=3237011 RepID=UPI0034D2BCEE
MDNPVASLSILADRIIYTSPSFAANWTSRPVMVLAVSTGETLRIATARECHIGRILLVAPNVSRSIEARNGGLYSVQLELTNAFFQHLLKHVLKGRQIVDLSELADDFVVRTAESALGQPQDCEQIRAGSEQILNTLFPLAARSQPIDARVDAVASWLSTHVPVRTNPQQLAHFCGLSESRLAHLFASATGSSIREYLLWVKMRKAAELFSTRSTLTEIAHATGFADLAHLSRTFKRYFGLTPSFLSNPAHVRVQIGKELAGDRTFTATR